MSGLYTLSTCDSGGSKASRYRSQGLNVSNYANESFPYCSSNGTGEIRKAYWQATTAGLNRNASCTFTSGVEYDWQVVSETTGDVLQSGTKWLDHGTNTFMVDGLPPDKYQIQFATKQVGWTGASSWCVVGVNEHMVSGVNSINGSNQGYNRSAPGNGSLSGTSQATEVVYNTLISSSVRW